MGIEISFVDLSELSNLKNAIKPNTKVSFVILWNWQVLFNTKWSI